jgi:hypothetical protein
MVREFEIYGAIFSTAEELFALLDRILQDAGLNPRTDSLMG